MADTVRIMDVGLRDGLQAEPRVVSTELKVWAVGALLEAGVPELEATSFVHPRVYPQLADAAEVLARVPAGQRPRLVSLVPNVRGAERALAAGAEALRVVICASETYNRRNVGMTVEESLAAAGRVLALASTRGKRAAAAVALAFGCPFEGQVPAGRVLELLERLAVLGFEELSLADSAGLAGPEEVGRLAAEALALVGPRPLSLHLHENGGVGLRNVRAGLEAGVRAFDASFGGLGGCPVNPAYTGNVSTEAVVALCEEVGLRTGIDAAAVAEVAARVRGCLADDRCSAPLPGEGEGREN